MGKSKGAEGTETFVRLPRTLLVTKDVSWSFSKKRQADVASAPGWVQ